MATPHVAGSAGILAQRRPDWSGAQLKAALMASARPNPEIGVFGQGAGRVDVPASIAQTLTTSPPSVSFGRQVWPHGDDAPVTRTLEYRNDGPDDVVVDLSCPPGPRAGTFTLGASRLTVPAAAAPARRTVHSGHSRGRTGRFHGAYVVATADGAVTPDATGRG